MEIHSAALQALGSLLDVLISGLNSLMIDFQSVLSPRMGTRLGPDGCFGPESSFESQAAYNLLVPKRIYVRFHQLGEHSEVTD